MMRRILFGAALILLALSGMQTKPPVATSCPTPKKPTLRTPAPTPERTVIALVNQERTRRGLKALTPNPKMMADAERWSMIQARTKMHHSRMGYGENVAFGQRTPESVQYAWMNSRGHRANILNPCYESIGVGLAYRGSTPYWTQVFQ